MVQNKRAYRLSRKAFVALATLVLMSFATVTAFAEVVPAEELLDQSETSPLSWTNEETGYRVLIVDDEDLLSAEEEAALLEDLKPNTEYGHAAFFSGYSSGMSTASYADELYYQAFGTESGSAFVIDMDDRIIQIHSNGYVYRVVTKAYANAITDDIYAYASRGDYYRCAQEAFAQELVLLEGGKISQPMRYITAALSAINIAIVVGFGIATFQRRRRKSRQNQKDEFIAITENDFHPTIVSSRVTKVRTYTEVESSGGGGGGGGGSRGGGGGSRGGGGGGSRGGGGGHRF